MKILAIDTSSKNCSISITEINEKESTVIISKNNDDEKTHSQKLMPLIEKMFDESKLTLDDIDLLACCAGPGSFTGIRIGVATVKAFADVKNIPIASVTSLEALMYNEESNKIIIPIIDAKNENIYSAMFKEKEHIIEDCAENINILLDKYLEKLNNTSELICFIGDGSVIYKEAILSKFKNYRIEFSTNNMQSSISVAKCAYKKFINGLIGDSNSISPIYLRKSQAERNLNGEK